MRGIAIPKKEYTQVQTLLPAICEMLASGKTKREIAEHYGLKMEQIKELLKRYRRRERKAAGMVPRSKGRPRKDTSARDLVVEQR